MKENLLSYWSVSNAVGGATEQLTVRGAKCPPPVLVVLSLLLLLMGACRPRDPTAHVPIGSRLEDLNRYVEPTWEMLEVFELKAARQSGVTGQNLVTNEFGTFIRDEGRSYQTWNASSYKREKFTGEVQFVIGDRVYGLLYVAGILRKKDWGYLPG